MSRPILPKRSSLRLRGYDYSEPGLYFVTICTHAHKSLLGDIRNGEMIHSSASHALHETWLGLPNRFPTMQLDSFIVMPNHVHAILALFRTPQKTPGAASSAPTNTLSFLGKIIRALKSLSAIEVNRLSNKAGATGLAAQLFRAHNSPRRRLGRRPALHPRKSAALGPRSQQSQRQATRFSKLPNPQPRNGLSNAADSANRCGPRCCTRRGAACLS